MGVVGLCQFVFFIVLLIFTLVVTEMVVASHFLSIFCENRDGDLGLQA